MGDTPTFSFDECAILVITHAIPRGLQADEVLQFGVRGTGAVGPQGPTHWSVVEEGRVA